MSNAKAPLSLKKETLKNLKVRTNLKGGLSLQQVAACCTKTHHCSMSFNRVDLVINPAFRSL